MHSRCRSLRVPARAGVPALARFPGLSAVPLVLCRPASMSHPDPIAAGTAWAEQLAQRLDEQRSRLRAAVDTQRQRARDWETEVQSHFTQVQEGLQAAADRTQQRDVETTTRLAD